MQLRATPPRRRLPELRHRRRCLHGRLRESLGHASLSNQAVVVIRNMPSQDGRTGLRSAQNAESGAIFRGRIPDKLVRAEFVRGPRAPAQHDAATRERHHAWHRAVRTIDKPTATATTSSSTSCRQTQRASPLRLCANLVANHVGQRLSAPARRLRAGANRRCRIRCCARVLDTGGRVCVVPRRARAGHRPQEELRRSR